MLNVYIIIAKIVSDIMDNLWQQRERLYQETHT